MDGEPWETPAIVSYVKLFGANGGLVHFLGEVDPVEVYIGMEVEPVFKDAAEREGSILDIVHFHAAEDGGHGRNGRDSLLDDGTSYAVANRG
jgi:uncharacterized OB-fold protein